MWIIHIVLQGADHETSVVAASPDPIEQTGPP